VGLAHAIFGARTLALAGELAPEDVGDWLSGVVVGDEIRGARGLGAGTGFRRDERSRGSAMACS
jgi:2-keto-3-deoxy-galactonokinase